MPSVPVLAAGDTEGIAWFAMPLIEGHDLGSELAAQRSDSKQAIWPAFEHSNYIAQVVEQIAGVADALHHIHSQGIIHRDIKPRNLLLNRNGQLLIVDFGLARLTDLEAITDPEAVQGTPYYMSPEQARALKFPIDHRTDVYSLCVVLFELLCLRRPFEGDSMDAVIGNIASGTHVSLRKANPRVPRDLVTICEKGMALQPSKRYASAKNLAEDLNRFLRLEAIQAKPAPLAERVYRRLRAHRRKVVAGLVLLGLALGWSGASYWQAKKAREMEWKAGLEAVLQDRPSEHDLRRAGEILAHMEAMNSVPSGLIDLKRSAQAAWEAERDRRTTQIKELYQEGSGGEPYQVRDRFVRLSRQIGPLLKGLLLAQKSAAAFPGVESVEQAAGIEAIYARVSIFVDSTSDPAALGSPAVAYATSMDPLSGLYEESIALGPLPIEGLPIRPGEWRFCVDVPGVGFGEYDRSITWETVDFEIQARILPSETVHAGMVEIQPLRGRFPSTDPATGKPAETVSYPDGDILMADYWVDEAALSNEEYWTYMQATGAQAPMSWRRCFDDGVFPGDWRALPVEEVGDRWLQLPVTGLSIFQAQACAEYYGKRLLGHYEQEYAGRGPEMLLLPWGVGDPPEGMFANVGVPKDPDAKHDREKYRQVLSHLVPVREPGYRHPPFDLFHTWGNIRYFTWAPVVIQFASRIQPQPGTRLTFGAGFQSTKADFSEADHGTADLSESYWYPGHGFRCGKSSKPQISLKSQ